MTSSDHNKRYSVNYRLTTYVSIYTYTYASWIVSLHPSKQKCLLLSTFVLLFTQITFCGWAWTACPHSLPTRNNKLKLKSNHLEKAGILLFYFLSLIFLMLKLPCVGFLCDYSTTRGHQSWEFLNTTHGGFNVMSKQPKTEVEDLEKWSVHGESPTCDS